MSLSRAFANCTQRPRTTFERWQLVDRHAVFDFLQRFVATFLLFDRSTKILFRFRRALFAVGVTQLVALKKSIRMKTFENQQVFFAEGFGKENVKRRIETIIRVAEHRRQMG